MKSYRFDTGLPKWMSLLLLLACPLLVSRCAAGDKDAQPKKGQIKEETPRLEMVGRDPRAFADAKAMYDRAPTTPLDDTVAGALLDDLERALSGRDGRTPLSPQFVPALGKLRQTSMSPTMIERLRRVAGAGATTVSPRPHDATAANAAFIAGNTAYENGRFLEAIDAYERALQAHPTFSDAWNNLALAEMHRGNDLLALFLFEALAKSAPRYAGTKINLTVCLERMGRSDEAHKSAVELTRGGPNLPLALYNLAWLENARGNSPQATGALGRAIAVFADYPLALWLRGVNTLESGKAITAEQAQPFPPSERSSALSAKPVIWLTHVPTDAFDGAGVAATIPAEQFLVVSEKRGDWTAVYWPIEGVKHRLWIRGAPTNSQPRSDAAPSRSTSRPALAPAPPTPVPAPARIPPGKPLTLDAFVGTWGERWADINNPGSITIQSVNGTPRVTMSNIWRVWGETFQDGQLVFRKRGGSSNWEFEYRIGLSDRGVLELRIHRVHDNRDFVGELYR